MKKIFGKGSNTQDQRLKETSADIRLPFRRSSDEPSAPDIQLKKTIIGRQSDLSFQNEVPNSLKCIECQYPLIAEPSKSSPCPNCGFSGTEREEPKPDARKTIAVNGLEMTAGQALETFKIKLIDEATKSEIKIQSDEPELYLNRSHLDPTNGSISGGKHILLKFKNNGIYIEDVSSNGATFLQVKDVMTITTGTRMVLGNKIYLFNAEPVSNEFYDKKTLRLGSFDVAGMSKGFNLTEEKSRRNWVFNENSQILSRSNLDINDNTLSSAKHAEISYTNGNWCIKDLSSTGATYIQITSEYQLAPNQKLIIGNKIFRFEYDN
jgi:pSer/pThr/pTyr-binding forkhead associated (FHA) protein